MNIFLAILIFSSWNCRRILGLHALRFKTIFTLSYSIFSLNIFFWYSRWAAGFLPSILLGSTSGMKISWLFKWVWNLQFTYVISIRAAYFSFASLEHGASFSCLSRLSLTLADTYLCWIMYLTAFFLSTWESMYSRISNSSLFIRKSFLNKFVIVFPFNWRMILSSCTTKYSKGWLISFSYMRSLKVL